MSQLSIISLTKTYPSGVTAIDDLNITVEKGESLAVFGLERSGKSTLLRVLAGLESVTNGQIILDGKDITDFSTKDRNVAYAFQSTSLDNQKNVFDNLAYGLKLRKVNQAVIDVKVKKIAEILGLSDLLSRKPKTLTSIERRRILLGRALVREPKVYLFDEVLAGLDGELRAQTLQDLVKLQIRLGATFVYATEDLREAFTVGNKVAIMSEGKLVQLDTPENIYKNPKNEFVAALLGKKGE